MQSFRSTFVDCNSRALCFPKLCYGIMDHQTHHIALSTLNSGQRICTNLVLLAVQCPSNHTIWLVAHSKKYLLTLSCPHYAKCGLKNSNLTIDEFFSFTHFGLGGHVEFWNVDRSIGLGSIGLECGSFVPKMDNVGTPPTPTNVPIGAHVAITFIVDYPALVTCWSFVISIISSPEKHTQSPRWDAMGMIRQKRDNLSCAHNTLIALMTMMPSGRTRGSRLMQVRHEGEGVV